MMSFVELSASAGQVLIASGSSDDGGNIGLVFLASGFIFYAVVYFMYRNVDKRHKHESETESALHNVEERDTFVKSMTGLSNREMAGANNRDVRGALRKFF
jgi:cbb3-type cytochrome oxidase subunit 3